MDGSIFDIKKFAIHDGPGIRTTVFLSGCPLKCWWCHNPESLSELNKLTEQSCLSDKNCLSKRYSSDEIYSLVKKDLVFYDESDGGVTFSGGEPLAQIDFLTECLYKCKMNYISTAVDTCGYAPAESFQRIYEYTDVFLYDIKLFDDELHLKYTGVSNILIKKNLEFLETCNSRIIVRIPLIPDVTDNHNNLGLIADYLTEFSYVDKVELLPYNELAEDKYRRLNQKASLMNLKTQSQEKLTELKNLMLTKGINVSINGY